MKKTLIFLTAAGMFALLMASSLMAVQGVTTAISQSGTSSQVSVTDAATRVAIARGDRNSLTIQNMGAVTMYCSPLAAVTTSTAGMKFTPGFTFTFDRLAREAWYCITASSTTTAGITEER